MYNIAIVEDETKDNNDKENTLIFSNGKINMDEIGSCVISGDLMKLGNILHCNLQFGNIFKYEQKDLKMEELLMKREDLQVLYDYLTFYKGLCSHIQSL